MYYRGLPNPLPVRTLLEEQSLLDCVPQATQVVCHHGDAQTNKPTKRDGRADPLISPLHNADKACCQLFILKYIFKI